MLQSDLDTLVTYNPTAVTIDHTLSDVRQRMEQHQIRHVPVVNDQRRVIGIVSDLDVRFALEDAQKASPDDDRIDVARIMTTDVIAMDRFDSPVMPLRAMLDGHFHSLPVVEEGRLIGIVTSADFLREFCCGQFDSRRLNVAELMLDHEASLDASASPLEAWRLMSELKTEYLAVLKGSCPIGVVSHRALRIHQHASIGCQTPADSTLGSLAETDAAVVKPTDTLAVVAAGIMQSETRAAMVCNRANRLLGLITEDAILAAVAQSLTPTET